VQQEAAVGVRVHPHPAIAGGGQFGQLGVQRAVGIEQLLGLVALHPALELRDVLRVSCIDQQRHLVGAERPLAGQAVDHLRPGPTLGRTQHDHRPARARGVPLRPGVLLDRVNVVNAAIHRRRHQLVHRGRVVPLDEVGRPPAAAQELVQLLGLDAG
jgi:hypothetical protein